MSANGLSLHIGLNFVDPKHYAGWDGELAACEADADDMEAIAQSCGYESSKLLRGEATGVAVRDAIITAADKLRAGDIFLLTYSGHGGQLPDKNDDEPDLNDETWCLFDGQVVDDELFALYTRFAKGVRIFVLSDSCHSGSVIKQYRDIATAGGRGVLRGAAGDGAEEPLRFRAMPTPIALRTYRQNRAYYDGYTEKLPSNKESARALAATVRLISGCADEQLSMDGAFNGLFTGTLLKVWKEGAFDGDYTRFHRTIATRMPVTQSPQHMVIGPANSDFDQQKPFTI